MEFDLLRIRIFVFLKISEKKLINELEKKTKKCLFLLNFENFKIMVFIILY